MDREEVIKWLKIMKANLNTFPEVSGEKKIEALAEAVRLLKNEQSEITTSSTTKNDLGVDAVSREKVWYMITGGKYSEEDDEKFIDRLVNKLAELPSVTPIRHKGHWIGRKQVGFGEWEDVTVLVNLRGCVTSSCECSECGEWLTGSDEYECSARYCPNCGAEMEGVE